MKSRVIRTPEHCHSLRMATFQRRRAGSTRNEQIKNNPRTVQSKRSATRLRNDAQERRSGTTLTVMAIRMAISRKSRLRASKVISEKSFLTRAYSLAVAGLVSFKQIGGAVWLPFAVQAGPAKLFSGNCSTPSLFTGHF